MKKADHNYNLKILHLLMTNPNRWFSTKELCQIFEIERKTVYFAIANLEAHGFGVDVVKGDGAHLPNPWVNYYKFNGVYGI